MERVSCGRVAPAMTRYDRGGVRITDRWLTAGNCRYRIDLLDDLRMVRDPADPLVRRLVTIAVLAVLVAVLFVAAIPTLAAAVTGVVVAGAPAVAAIVRAWLCPRGYLLWAEYEGCSVLLCRTADRTEFGKMGRAVVRARLAGASSNLR